MGMKGRLILIFFDMDGVLAVYNPNDYQGDPMPFEIRGSRYFLHRPADENAVQLFIKASNHFPRGSIAALSTISINACNTPGLASEHKIDKGIWLLRLSNDNELPCIPLLFAQQGITSKPEEATKLLKRDLTPADILIDDFNSNLTAWHEAGGTAIKWLNGLNASTSWDGISIGDEPADKALCTLIETIDTAS